MEVRPDFGARLEDSCRTIPTSVIGALLRTLLPKDREPTTKPASYDQRLDPNGVPIPPDRVTGRGGVNRSTGRRRMAASHAADRVSTARPANYRILQPMAHRNHRFGTWRYAMVESVMSAQSTSEAFEKLRQAWPEHAGKGIDFKWNVAQGYITFDMKPGSDAAMDQDDDAFDDEAY